MEYHLPVMLTESVNGMNIKPDGIYVDLTFGGGGHSAEILKRLKNGRLVAFDQDFEAEKNAMKDQRLLFIKGNFRFFKNFLRYHGIDQVDGIIADLGVSSFHFDASKRGFSFRFDEPLDMRMNPGARLTAFDVVNNYTHEQLTRIFREYGEVSSASGLAWAIVTERSKRLIRTTGQLKDILSGSVKGNKEHKFLAKIFQALRIEVNREIEVLKEMLLQTPGAIKEDGILAVITYHSLEDRLVKNFIRNGRLKGEAEKDMFGNTEAPFEAVNRKVIIASEEEIKRNNRARSAKLRLAKRTKWQMKN